MQDGPTHPHLQFYPPKHEVKEIMLHLGSCFVLSLQTLNHVHSSGRTWQLFPTLIISVLVLTQSKPERCDALLLPLILPSEFRL